jgi:hypothetical protein
LYFVLGTQEEFFRRILQRTCYEDKTTFLLLYLGLSSEFCALSFGGN